MLGHVGVDAPQFGQLINIVQTAMVRQEFDRLTMDVLLVSFILHAHFQLVTCSQALDVSFAGHLNRFAP